MTSKGTEEVFDVLRSLNARFGREAIEAAFQLLQAQQIGGNVGDATSSQRSCCSAMQSASQHCPVGSPVRPIASCQSARSEGDVPTGFQAESPIYRRTRSALRCCAPSNVGALDVLPSPAAPADPEAATAVVCVVKSDDAGVASDPEGQKFSQAAQASAVPAHLEEPMATEGAGGAMLEDTEEPGLSQVTQASNASGNALKRKVARRSGARSGASEPKSKRARPLIPRQSQGRTRSLPIDTQQRIADFCPGPELWVLYRVSPALQAYIVATLQARLDGYRLQKVWDRTSLPLPQKAHHSVRLSHQKSNVRDIMVADQDLVYVQLNDLRKWNTNKSGKRLEVGLVACTVSDTFSYAIGSLWEFALEVPLTPGAPKARQRDFTQLQSAAYRCTFGQTPAPSLTVSTHLAPASSLHCSQSAVTGLEAPPLKPLSATVAADGQSVSLRWNSGRFEFLALDGEYCCALIRSAVGPAELLALHVPSRTVRRVPLPPHLTYSTKVARIVRGSVYLVAFEVCNIRVFRMSETGELDGGRPLLDEACAAFIGFTEDAVVMRTRSCLHLVQIPEGMAQATLPLTRLGLRTLLAAAYHHPSKRLVVYDGSGSMLEYPLLQAPSQPMDPCSSQTKVFPIFQATKGRTQSAEPRPSQVEEKAPTVGRSTQPPRAAARAAALLRFST